MISLTFFGTHNFATHILKHLIADERFTVSRVITQPDKPVGRKKILTPPPVKILAQQHGIEVMQPESLKNVDPELFSSSDIGVTAQYGLLIPKAILEAFPHGMLNVHTSLLPAYRGASPIQSAILHGEKKTGVTIMRMDVGLDTGPILLQKEIEIGPDETYLDIDARLAEIGAQTLIEAIPPFISGELEPIQQDESQATTCTQLSRDDGQIDWTMTTQEIYNRYRAFLPWPGVWTSWQEKRIKIHSCAPSNLLLDPGLVSIQNGKMFVGTSDGSIEILALQLEGKPQMSVQQFLQGQSIDGATLGI